VLVEILRDVDEKTDLQQPPKMSERVVVQSERIVSMIDI